MKKSEIIDKIKKVWKEKAKQEEIKNKEIEKSFSKFSVKDLKEILMDEELDLAMVKLNE